MIKSDADKRKLNDEDMLEFAEKKFSSLNKSALGNASLFVHKFLLVDNLYYEDVEERLTRAQWLQILESRQRELLLQQNAYLIKNTLIKQGSPADL